MSVHTSFRNLRGEPRRIPNRYRSRLSPMPKPFPSKKGEDKSLTYIRVKTWGRGVL